MEKMKGTPGPWSVGGEEKPVAETTVYVQVEDIVFTIAHCDLSYVYFPNKANAKPLAHSANLANAQLIAAAPELLEALNDLLDDVGRASSMIGARKARAAIAKATGANHD